MVPGIRGVIMNIIFYGAGECGKRALVKSKKYEGTSQVVGFADSNKTGRHCSLPIMGLDGIDKEETAVVITVVDIDIMLDIYHMLFQRQFKNIYLYLDKDNEWDYGTDFLEAECESCEGWGGCVIKQVEMHLADHCNLNCRGCTHFSPLFAPGYPEFDDVIRDIKQLRSKFSHILYFFLLGGEPFLNKEIVRYIEEIHKIMPLTGLRIVTNGLLIPSLPVEILDCIHRNQVLVSISEYEPTHEIINLIKSRLDEFSIAYEIRPYENKQKFIKPISTNKNSRYPNKCMSNGCINIWNGKIARCPTLMYIGQFNKIFSTELPDDEIYDLYGNIDGSELKELLKKEVPLCRHCVKNEIEWGRCDRNLQFSDFATDE